MKWHVAIYTSNYYKFRIAKVYSDCISSKNLMANGINKAQVMNLGINKHQKC